MWCRSHFTCLKYFVLFLFGAVIGANLAFFRNLCTKNDSQVVSVNEIGSDAIVNSDELFSSIKILCMVLTSPKNHRKRAIHVKNTWGQRCNKLIFGSTEPDDEINPIVFDVEENYFLLWGKTKRFMKYIHETYYDEYDWFFKADDDTYAIMENMRYMLTAYSSADSIYFGNKLKTPLHKWGYFAGGAGYVMSKTALRKLVTEAIPNADICKSGARGDEDWELALCMENVGVYPVNTLDQLHRERFLNFIPEAHFYHLRNEWYWKRLFYVPSEGANCCSNYLISIHYNSPYLMYFHEYYTYYFHVYGVRHTYNPLPSKRNFDAVVYEVLSDVAALNATNAHKH